MSYSKPQELFIDLIKYNENNIELLGNMQLHISNIYYITIFDLDNTQITKIISYLVDSENSNPFDNFKSNISLDEEQICKIDLVKGSLQQISKDINTTLEIAHESNGKIVLIENCDGVTEEDIRMLSNHHFSVESVNYDSYGWEGKSTFYTIILKLID